MFYDRYSEKNELFLLGHMCGLRVNVYNLAEFLSFVAEHNIRASFSITIFEEYYYISLYFKTKKLSKKAFDVLLEWNP